LLKGPDISNSIERQPYKTTQDNSKSQTGITIKKQKAGSNFVRPTTFLIDTKTKCIVARESRNSLTFALPLKA
jgi:hypothetical protein